MAEVTKRQRIEFEGKTYDLVWYGEKARVLVLTKNGFRSLNGFGRANRAGIAAKVIAAARTTDGA